MKTCSAALFAVMSTLALAHQAFAADGNPARGQQIFRACAACHSLEPDRNMTGPSLADLWKRKAGSLGSFMRYSPALKSAGIDWDDHTLDAWIKDPQQLVPGNQMTFPGIKDAGQRADLLAFLKEATQPGRATRRPPLQDDRMGQMGGMMGGGNVLNLKKLNPEGRVQAIGHCRDTYRVTTGDGKTRDFWERNLRFKTDASDDGPVPGAPAIVDAGMMGDRASVIFAKPDEISRFISEGC